jgi:uncharacterized protein
LTNYTKLKGKFLRFNLLLILVLTVSVLSAQNIPKRPTPPKLVNDFANVLSPEEEAQLEQKLVAYDDSTSNQVAIVTVPTLDNYPIEEYALQLFRTWGIGNKNTNNGVLIIAAINDRSIRIETGYGLEGAIPDITASQIIRNDIGPSFREGNYYEGFDKAVESIILAAAGEYKAPEGYNNREKKSPLVPILVFVVILFIIISNINRGGGGGFMSRRGYRGFGGPVFFPGGFGGGSGGGFGGGGFGGGGFGGFGGGSSGGGGASGSW